MLSNFPTIENVYKWKKESIVSEQDRIPLIDVLLRMIIMFDGLLLKYSHYNVYGVCVLFYLRMKNCHVTSYLSYRKNQAH